MTRQEKSLWPVFFLAPALLVLLVFQVGPVIAGFREAVFTDNLSMSREPRFVGLWNYARMVRSGSFWTSLRTTLVFSLVINPLQVIASLLFGVLANQRVRGIRVFRSIYLLPVTISIVVTGMVWQLMLDEQGMVNGMLANVGIPRQPFFTSERLALWSVIGVMSWKGICYWMIFFLAGLQGIPSELYEAAEIDGASNWQSFVKITLPLLSRVILFVAVVDTAGNFRTFAPIYVLTRGGPHQSTSLIMWELYQRGFLYGDLGLASAVGSVVLAISVAIGAVQFRLFHRDSA